MMKAKVMTTTTVRRLRGLDINVASHPRRRYVQAVTMNTMLRASGTSKSIAGPREIARPPANPIIAGTSATMLSVRCEAR